MSDSPKKPTSSAEQENPLANIILNVLAPVLILSYCSKDGNSLWHLGPYKAMGLAIAIPVFYGIWHFIQHKKFNIFSAVGFVNVLLTGIISIYLYSVDSPEARGKAPLLFGLKEAIQPLILGSLFLITAKSKTPLFNTFIYNDGIFDHSRINKAIQENGKQTEHTQLIWNSTKLFFGSFCLSAVMNLGLAFYFMGSHALDPADANWTEIYNQQTGKIMGWGFLVIGVPILIIGGFILSKLIKGLKGLTGLETDRILQAR
ncbi:MAG: VC0807 family protein [Akkermansiaceae bacterium]